MSTLNREQFLAKLNSVQAGLAVREMVEQTSCFVFTGGKVITFNDEVACQCEVEVDIEGAVPAKILLGLLQKMEDEAISVEVVDGEDGNTYLSVQSENSPKRAGINMTRQIALPFQKVETPTSWMQLAEGFTNAVMLCVPCASTDSSSFWLSCLHICPKVIEASDDFQAIQVKVATGLDTPRLVRAQAVNSIVPLGMTEMAATEAWLHFRNPNGLILSVRTYADEYNANMASFFKVEGTETALPKGLIAATEKAELFGGEDATKTPQITVVMSPGKLRVKGVNRHGFYTESRPVNYDGPPISFVISPQLLREIVTRHNECVISPERLLVNGGSFRYIACLEVPGDN